MKLKSISLVIGCFVILIGSNASSQDQNFIPIGSIASLTGYGAFAGNAELNGASLAVEEINNSNKTEPNGTNHIKFKLISEDNQSDQKQTLTIYRKLKSLNNVFAIIGPNWSEFASPIAPLANSEKTIMITPTGHTPDLLINRPYVFSLQFPAKESITPVVKYLESRNFEEIIIFVSPNAFYEMLSNTIISSFPKTMKIRSEIVPSESLDFKSNLSKLRNIKNLGIIVFLLENGPAATFVKQAKSIGLPAENLMLGPIVRYDDILKNDKNLSNGLIHFDYIYEIPNYFKDKFKKRFNVEPTFGSVQSYDAVNLLKNEIQKCGLEKEKLIECIAKSKSTGVSGPIEFKENRDRVTSIPVIQVFKINAGESMRLSSD
jgi:branched-chain amino acid transport system substrate-binding protein